MGFTADSKERNRRKGRERETDGINKEERRTEELKRRRKKKFRTKIG
jgi:hypothetical protein